MSPKLKCHPKAKVTKTWMSPKPKCHQYANVTKHKCHQIANVTKKQMSSKTQMSLYPQPMCASRSPDGQYIHKCIYFKQNIWIYLEEDIVINKDNLWILQDKDFILSVCIRPPKSQSGSNFFLKTSLRWLFTTYLWKKIRSLMSHMRVRRSSRSPKCIAIRHD